MTRSAIALPGFVAEEPEVKVSRTPRVCASNDRRLDDPRGIGEVCPEGALAVQAAREVNRRPQPYAAVAGRADCGKRPRGKRRPVLVPEYPVEAELISPRKPITADGAHPAAGRFRQAPPRLRRQGLRASSAQR